MELTHRFTVPGSIEETWTRFHDIGSLAQCFPGAQVTSVDQNGFQGTCKVKLGPIALVYAGEGRFVEDDPLARRLVVEAKGRDKRGNGTAGATVVLTFAAGASQDTTDVEVATDLSITGKPAQFGRGVMQDVSDKLLGQFVGCLEKSPAGAGGTEAPTDPGRDPGQDPDAGPASVPSGAAVAESSADDPDGGPASVPSGAAVAESSADDPDGGPASVPSGAAAAGSPAEHLDAGPASWPAATASPPPLSPNDDALNLGATVLPVLLKSYGKQAAAAGGVVAVMWWLLRRRAR